ncbi:hypothetical protein ACTJIW_24055, partial [Flavobacterium sp. 22659]|uniref:hypothetical protein n=1 Tax=Flavobacterium sp. 22659 TaxID=3453953 RepID=UPI003F877005
KRAPAERNIAGLLKNISLRWSFAIDNKYFFYTYFASPKWIFKLIRTSLQSVASVSPSGAEYL